MALIEQARATALIPNFDPADTSIMSDIVDAASGMVERYCNRKFEVTDYDDLVDGTGHANLLLDNYPVTRLDRILYNRVQVMYIGNLKTTVSRASFRLDQDNLYLECADNGILFQHTIPRNTCVTFKDLADKVDAFASEGWDANALGIYQSWRLADLYAPQGGHEVRWSGYGYIWHHSFGVPAAISNPEIGELVTGFSFQRGYRVYRVIYQAGFNPVPPEIQQATAELAASTFLAREINPNLKSETLGSYSYTTQLEKSFEDLSLTSIHALSQYKNYRVPKFRA